MKVKRIATFVGKIALWIIVIICGVAVGKAFQYSAVELLGPSLGFDLASFIGLVPFLLLLFWVAKKLPLPAGKLTRA